MGDFSGEKLSLAIQEAGLTNAEVARLMKVRPQTVNDYIKGNPSLKTWNKFYEAIGKQPLKQYSAFDILDNPLTLQEPDESKPKQSATDFNLVGQLKELGELYKLDLLTPEEYTEAKQLVIKKFRD